MTPPDDTDYDDASGYQGSAYTKQQNSYFNQNQVAEKPPLLKQRAKDLSSAAASMAQQGQDAELASVANAAKQASEAPLTQAVNHLNKQTERSLGYPASSGGDGQ